MSIQTQYEQFHLNNPHVLTTLEALAEEWLDVVRRPAVGIGMLWEVMRWNVGIHTDGDPFKLNNIFRSRYARELLARHPEWEGRIKTRQLVSP